MLSAWMVGIEDEPNRCVEICIVDIFGNALVQDTHGTPTTALSCGIHPFRDPALIDDFAAPQLPPDITVDHTYAVD